MSALILRGQRVRVEGWEQTHWAAEVTMENFSYGSRGEVRFKFSDWKVVQSWANLSGEIFTASECCTHITITPEEISWESEFGGKWRITPLTP